MLTRLFIPTRQGRSNYICDLFRRYPEYQIGLDCGAYTYRVRPIYLTAQDSDKVFLRLKEKIKTGEKLTEEDFAELSLTPLMSGNLSRKETIREAICLAKQEKV